MDEVKNDSEYIHQDDIRRPFKVYMEAGVAKRFIKAVKIRGSFVRETMRDLMIKFSDEVLGKDVK